MPSVELLKSGKYRAQVCVFGERASKSFRTKREAIAWGAAKDAELRALAVKPPGEKHTLGELIDKFYEEETPKRKGGRWERIRLNALRSMLPAGDLVGSVGKATINAFRMARLVEVKPGTVLREMSLLSSLFSYAKDGLGWIETNPVSEAGKPASPAHRKIIYTYPTIRRILKTTGYSPRSEIRSVSGAVAVAFMFAMRTGLRAGEACGLRWSDVSGKSCHVDSKTDAGNRDVPLTKKAFRLLEKMRGYDPDFVFGISSQSLDAMFRKYRIRSGVVGYTFHDTRHTAATWMVKHGSINVLELCKIMGWTDPKMAMVYFNPTSDELKRRLETRRT